MATTNFSVSVKAFPIHSWDLYSLKGDYYVPMITFEPDFEFLEMSLRNSNRVRVAVTGADARYNGVYYAILNSPTSPNVCDTRHVLILHGCWQGYPLKEGSISILPESNVPNSVKVFGALTQISQNFGDIFPSAGPSLVYRDHSTTGPVNYSQNYATTNFAPGCCTPAYGGPR